MSLQLNRLIPLGNVAQVFNRDSWPILDSLTDDYQQVVKLNGIFGVRYTYVRRPLGHT